MDNDAKMLEQMGTALTSLQVKYRESSLEERMAMKPMFEEPLRDYTTYQLALLKEGIITTDKDLVAMRAIKKEIDAAAQSQEIAVAIAKTIAFIAAKV